MAGQGRLEPCLVRSQKSSAEILTDAMTKLDEIQEAIKAVGNVPDDRISSKEAVAITLSLLNQTVEELKRIDAERKAMDKLLIELAAKDT